MNPIAIAKISTGVIIAIGITTFATISLTRSDTSKNNTVHDKLNSDFDNFKDYNSREISSVTWSNETTTKIQKNPKK